MTAWCSDCAHTTAAREQQSIWGLVNGTAYVVLKFLRRYRCSLEYAKETNVSKQDIVGLEDGVRAAQFGYEEILQVLRAQEKKEQSASVQGGRAWVR